MELVKEAAVISEDHLEDQRIGGAADLPERVATALTACREETGLPPTAKRYYEWRRGLPEEERTRIPSLTAVVPMAYPSWEQARAAAGVSSSGRKRTTHGPTPKWSEQECLALVTEWLANGGSGTLAAFTIWIDEQRASSRAVPSVSTIRLRLRLPWQAIREEAAAQLAAKAMN